MKKKNKPVCKTEKRTTKGGGGPPKLQVGGLQLLVGEETVPNQPKGFLLRATTPTGQKNKNCSPVQVLEKGAKSRWKNHTQ